MESSNHPIERKDFEALIHAIGFEIEHAQVKLIVAANAQMLFHYWKLGNFILYHQKRLGTLKSTRTNAFLPAKLNLSIVCIILYFYLKVF